MEAKVICLLFFVVVFVNCINSSPADSETTTRKYFKRRLYTEAPANGTDDSTVTQSTTTTRKFKYPFKAKSTTTTTTTTTTTEAPKIEKDETIIPSTESTSESTTESTSTSVPKTTSPPKLSCGKKNGDNHPWIVILEHTDPLLGKQSRRTFSKGVLIDKRYVLTTVSSIHNSHPFWEVSRVRLGDHPVGVFKKISSYSPVFVDVEEIIVHPKKDIALVKLAQNVTFTELIQPICLPTSDNYNFRELFLHICRKSRNYTPTRVKVETMSVLPISPQDCSTLFHRKGFNFNSREEFCTWDERGDTCTGDLGGPLIGKQNDRFHVIGLSSYVTSNFHVKDDSLPGIYTRVGFHLNWIEQVLAKGI